MSAGSAFLKAQGRSPGGHATEAVRQQAIVAALFSPDRGAALELAAAARVCGTADSLTLGLGAYRGNGIAIAERALQAIYPVTFELLGESAAPAAAHLWRAQPPGRGDLAEWGAGFAKWLAAQPSLADLPQVPGCAAIEWARHRAAAAVDTTMDVGSLALLGEHPAEALRLRLKPDVSLVRGASGFYETWLEHARRTVAGDATADGAAPPVTGSGAVAVWRDGFAPRVLPLNGAWSDWLEWLIGGASLEALLDSLPAPDLETTLASLITRSWLLDVVTKDATAPETFNTEDPA